MSAERAVFRSVTATLAICAAVAPGCTAEPAGGSGAGRGGGASGGGSATGGASGTDNGGSGGASASAGKAGSASSTGGAGGASGGAGGKAGSSTSGGAGGSAGSSGGSAGTDEGGEGGTDTGGGAGTSSAGTGGASGSGAAGSAGAPATWVPSFQTTTLSMDHTAEGADVGDIDGDGVLDLVAGPIWYKGPSFAMGGKILATVPTFTNDQYSTFFLTFVADIDGDMNLDVIGIGDAGGGNGSGTPNAHWYKNPGPANLGAVWQKTPIFDGLIANESPAFADLLGDSKKELVFMTAQRLGYADPGATPTDPWVFHAIDSMSFGTPYVHGLGVGDVNGDGRKDVLERSGIWLQPASGSTWTRHAVDFGEGLTGTRPSNWGGAQMAVYDVDGDGDADVVTALAAHRYGLSWFEQEDLDTFTPHEILPPSASATSISQMHALAVADMNGDGLSDVVIGKRYYAHPSNNADPGTTDPPLVEWFELSRTGGVSFTPHTIHSDSGVGCNFVALDVTGEGKPDVFSTNKHGTFLHAQR